MEWSLWWSNWLRDANINTWYDNYIFLCILSSILHTNIESNEHNHTIPSLTFHSFYHINSNVESKHLWANIKTAKEQTNLTQIEQIINIYIYMIKYI